MDNYLELKIPINEDTKQIIAQIEGILAQNEKRDFTKMKSGDRFFYHGIEWVYLGMEQGGALCITAECYKEMPFDKEGRNNWNVSSLKEELNSDFLNKLDKKDLKSFEMDLVADNGDDAYGTSIQYVGILSCDQYRKYRKVIPLFDEWMWTCTPWYCGPTPSYASIVRSVYTDGSLYYSRANNSGGVVPACVFCC